MKGVYIIAEIGNNHNGSKDKALELIDASAGSGADAVKFQSFSGLDIVSPKVTVEEYPKWNVKGYKYWYEFLDSIALKREDHQEIIDYALSKKLDFITTPLSIDVVGYLELISGVKAYKIASMDLNNIPLLKVVAATEKPTVISTGMGSLEEIRIAVELFSRQDLTLLHCVSDYPLDPKEAGLNNILVLLEEFPELKIGFSDHSLGCELSIAAVSLGAKVIEKHITLSRKDPSPAEHHFAMEPDEFGQMVKWIRAIETSLSFKGFFRSKSEKENCIKYRRSYHYAKDLDKGYRVGANDILLVRPADGIEADKLDKILGRPLTNSVKAFDPCHFSDFK